MTAGTTSPTESNYNAALRALGNLAQIAARLGALALMVLYFRYQVGPAFFSAGNVENIFMQSAVYTMAGLGMTMVIITGGIDLAAGSTIALSMVVTALVLDVGRIPPELAAVAANTPELLPFGIRTALQHPHLWTLLSVLVGTLAGASVGLMHGLIVTGLNGVVLAGVGAFVCWLGYHQSELGDVFMGLSLIAIGIISLFFARVQIVPFIVTLGSMQAIRGLTKRIAENQEISPKPGWLYKNLMYPVQGREFNWQLVPVGVWATLLAALLAAGLLRYTRLGRRIYAVGSNESTARLCGVPVARTKIVVYMMAGLFAGLAGVLEFSRLNLGQPTGALAYELYIIAACVIGGASLMGGVGTISGTVIGALLIGVLNVGTQQIGWEKYDQEIAIGAIIIIAAGLDQLRVRRMKG